MLGFTRDPGIQNGLFHRVFNRNCEYPATVMRDIALSEQANLTVRLYVRGSE
jgi:hypothetical protein